MAAKETDNSRRRNSPPGDETLSASAAVASGNVLQFVAASTLAANQLALNNLANDNAADHSIADDNLGPPRPAEPLDGGGADVAGEEVLAADGAVPVAGDAGARSVSKMPTARGMSCGW